MSLRQPGCSLPARFLQHPQADGDDEAAPLERRDDGIGPDDALRGVAPTEERLDSGERVRLKIDRRLIEEKELARFESVMKVRVQVALVLDRHLHRRRKDGGAALAGRLGPVQRDVGVA